MLPILALRLLLAGRLRVPMNHGLDCDAKTIPNYTCRYCGEKAFFFSCDCGCRVMFDELGPPWPVHDCRTQPSGSAPYTGPSSWGSTVDINVLRGGQGSSDLLPGLRSGTDSIAPSMLNRARESRNTAREIMRIEPHGSQPVEIVGVVLERSQPDLARRYGLERGSIGFGQLAKAVGDTGPVQFTVQVDELPEDAAAIDYLSYTFLSSGNQAGKDIQKHTVIRALLSPVAALGIGRLWLTKEIERLY